MNVFKVKLRLGNDDQEGGHKTCENASIICLKISHIHDSVTVSEVIQMCVSSHSFLSSTRYTPC